MVPPVLAWFNTGTNSPAKRICLAKYRISCWLADPTLGEDFLRAAYADSCLRDRDFFKISRTSGARPRTDSQSNTVPSARPTSTFALPSRAAKPAAVPPPGTQCSPHRLHPAAPSTPLKRKFNGEYDDPFAARPPVSPITPLDEDIIKHKLDDCICEYIHRNRDEDRPHIKKTARKLNFDVKKCDLVYNYSPPKGFSDAERLGDFKVMQTFSYRNPKLVDWRREMEKAAEDEAKEMEKTAAEAKRKRKETVQKRRQQKTAKKKTSPPYENKPAISKAKVEAKKIEEVATVTRGGRRSRPTRRALGFD